MKKVKKLTIILTIILICMVAFIGIYMPQHGIMRNVVKDYDFGMNIEGYREVRMQPQKDEEITSEKVQQVKDLIQKRLEQLGSQDHLIKVNYGTGEIVLELEETDRTDNIVGDIYTAGNLEMVDSEDADKVFMTNEHIKNTSVKYSTTEYGTAIYLDIEFTEEGSKIIKDLSANEYKTIETKETEKEDKEEVKQPKLTLKIDGTQLVSSSFDEQITEGRLQLTLNSVTTDTQEIQDSVNSGVALVSILNNGPLPIKYDLAGNTYIYSEITENIKVVFSIAISIVLLIALVILVIKYKIPALLCIIAYIGFVALYLLVLRYANVVITLEGIAGILIVLIINYLLLEKTLSKSSIFEALKEIGIQSIPVIAVIVAFSFIGWTNIASFGMTMFWGLLLATIYNFIVTKALLEK